MPVSNEGKIVNTLEEEKENILNKVNNKIKKSFTNQDSENELLK